MSDKYIIKNCPVAFNTRVDGTYCNDVEITNGKNIHCQYITDCVLKQIVELCMEDWEDMTIDRFQRELLDLLDIQEVE
jgi:hypothetical protein